MKKFYSFLFAAVALVGFAACNQDFTENVAPENGEMVSFKATIADETRVGLDGLNNTVWVAGDKVMVDGYEFICQSDLETFVCTQPGCSKLLSEDYGEVTAVYAGRFDASNEGVVDSTKGSAGAVLEATGSLEEGLSFEIKSAFLKFTTTSTKATLMCEGDIFSHSPIRVDDLTPENGVYYVAIEPGTATLYYEVNGVMAKRIENKTFEAGKIYNLGALEPVAEPEMTTVYLVPGAWAGDNALFAVFYWVGANNTDTLMTKHATKDGVYEVKVAANADGLLFKRLDPSTHQMWNQTVDLTLPTEADKNYFYFETWGTDATGGKSTGRWDVDPFAPETPNQASNWCVTGAFCSWSDAGTMVTTTVKNLFVAKNIDLAAYSEFKIKLKGTWDGSIGAGAINYINKNSKVVGYVGSSTNFSAVEAGKYDVYFDALTNNVYLMVAGTDYSTAATQDKNGPMPDMSGVTWGLCGAHNSWGGDDPLVWDGTIGMYVAKSVKLTGEFKVRANNSWGEDYGCGGTITVNATAGKAMSRGGGNCKVASGTYDVYFDLATKKIWVKTPGSAAPQK
jgi:hypothetical protein